ncbi:MAG TPA: DUF2652 domain-containing protein [Candidatus Limnocylindria bacterium]|nr:DUF2652 domain-containing protein [Candidatus Limnocylindria bacterium]
MTLASTFHREVAEGPLLIADISGYTSFLQDVTHAHRDDAFAGGAVPAAYGLMSSLLDGIVTKVVPPFTLSKLEGDAVFAFAADGASVPRGEALLDCIRGCYAFFRTRLAEAGDIWTCTCAACARASTLDLKFVVHAGRYILQQIAGNRELSGPEVVMVHRLLKNRAATVVGHGAYALISAAAANKLDIGVAGAIPITETYEHYPPIDAFAFALR